MWPRSRKSGEEILRIGRHAIERWTLADGVLSMVASHGLGPDAGVLSHVASLVDGVGVLYPAAPSIAITLVLESAWMPLVLVDAGPPGPLRK